MSFIFQSIIFDCVGNFILFFLNNTDCNFPHRSANSDKILYPLGLTNEQETRDFSWTR